MKRNEGDVYERSGELVIKHNGKIQSYYRFLVEQYLGQQIPAGYIVHHIDFDHNNNSLDNLMLMPQTLHCWVHRCKAQGLFVSNLDKFKTCTSVELSS
jgi:hypothetical protein